jgi:hypothetical protein
MRTFTYRYTFLYELYFRGFQTISVFFLISAVYSRGFFLQIEHRFYRVQTLQLIKLFKFKRGIIENRPTPRFAQIGILVEVEVVRDYHNKLR